MKVEQDSDTCPHLNEILMSNLVPDNDRVPSWPHKAQPVEHFLILVTDPKNLNLNVALTAEDDKDVKNEET